MPVGYYGICFALSKQINFGMIITSATSTNYFYKRGWLHLPTHQIPSLFPSGSQWCSNVFPISLENQDLVKTLESRIQKNHTIWKKMLIFFIYGNFINITSSSTIEEYSSKVSMKQELTRSTSAADQRFIANYEAHCQFTQTTQVKILASTNIARASFFFSFFSLVKFCKKFD